MIFATVGTQLAFPRLTKALDEYASTTDEEIIAQVCDETEPRPNLNVRGMIEPKEFNKIFSHARVVVAHAGIGTILTARDYRRPLIIVPRRHALGEHRNNHQVATASALKDLPGVHVAMEIEQMLSLLQREDLEPANDYLGPRYDYLIKGLSGFLSGIEPEHLGKAEAARARSFINNLSPLSAKGASESTLK
jgi:UDP-N-acetylglucosamine transferase subunit ALG13